MTRHLVESGLLICVTNGRNKRVPDELQQWVKSERGDNSAEQQDSSSYEGNPSR